MGTPYGNYTDLKVTLDNYVAVAEIQRPPHNFFDYDLIEAFAECFEDLANDNNCRAIVMCAAGKNFCAGANFNAPVKDAKPRGGHRPIFWGQAAELRDGRSRRSGHSPSGRDTDSHVL